MTSEVCARVLMIATAVALLIYLITLLRIVVIPVAIAILLTALLVPAVHWLHARRVPRGPATALVLVGGLAVLGRCWPCSTPRCARSPPVWSRTSTRSTPWIRTRPGTNADHLPEPGRLVKLMRRLSPG